MTHSLSPRLNGAIRTPYLRQFQNSFISFELVGGDFAAQRTVIDNGFLSEKQSYLSSLQPTWTTVSTLREMPQRHNYIEFATKTSNPNFPPRVGLGGACSDEQIADPVSWFGIKRAVLHDAPHAPLDELKRFEKLFAGPTPRSLEQLGKRYQQWFSAVVTAWAEDESTEEDLQILRWLLSSGLLSNKLSANTELAELVQRYRSIESQVEIPWTVHGLHDVDAGYDYPLNVRGEYDRLGDEIPRGYVSALCSGDASFQAVGSGRLELAQQVARDDNPLTARVIVNRNWQWLFGTGLVDTPNDFGRLGDTPSHPELLDWLTKRFIDRGWSIKQLVREILLSQTWQQSAEVTSQGQTLDPGNRLLHHYPLRRLEAEQLRDAILSVSGRINHCLYGPPIEPYRTAEDDQKRLFAGPVDGEGRRSLYTEVTIMEPARFLATFNTPDPKIPTGRRDVSNTPAQSLSLLNDPFVTGQAAYWAEHLLQRQDVTAEERLSHMFIAALSRQPSQFELTRWSAALDELAELHQVEAVDLLTSQPVWQDIAHAFFNVKEFLYYR